MARVLSASLVVAALACGGSLATTDGGSVSGSATVNGTIAGTPIHAHDAITLDTTTSGPVITSKEIAITSSANACGCVGGASNAQHLTLVIGAPGTSFATGQYSFGPSAGPNPGGALAEASYYAATCCAGPVAATSGSVTFSEIDATTSIGTFDISFASGDHLTGTFTAPTCTTEPSPDAATCP